jgi:hypothetical protein
LWGPKAEQIRVWARAEKSPPNQPDNFLVVRSRGYYPVSAQRVESKAKYSPPALSFVV